MTSQRPVPATLQRLTAEFLGTAFLLAAVVGSGIMGVDLACGNVAIALLANAAATGAALVALILALGPISGAHFNPAVTLLEAVQGGIQWRLVPAYVAAQFAGALVGVWSVHLMFGQAVWQTSLPVRGGASQWVKEIVVPFGLLVGICGCARCRPYPMFSV